MGEHGGRTRGRATMFAAVLLAALVAGALPASATTPQSQNVLLGSRQVWTPTSLTVNAGDTITVRATGFIHFGNRPIDHVSPDGVAWGAKCTGIATVQGHWPVGGLACWSLVGRVGTGAPFELGANGQEHATTSGPLQLGINDNLLVDNSGAWPVVVTVTPAAAATVPVTVRHKTSSGSSSALPWVFVLLALVVLGALIALVVRRKRNEAIVAFQPPDTLRSATVEVRVDTDGSVQRRAENDALGPLVVVGDEFEDVHIDRRIDAFVWRGWELRVTSARLPFTVAHGEAFRHGQCVAGSLGVTPTPDGYTKALLPRTFAASWVFALGSVVSEGIIDGTLTFFVFGDQPLEPQVDKLISSLDKLRQQLPVLLDRLPQADVALAARIGSDLPRG
jgi:hypothetical protein